MCTQAIHAGARANTSAPPLPLQRRRSDVVWMLCIAAIGAAPLHPALAQTIVSEGNTYKEGPGGGGVQGDERGGCREEEEDDEKVAEAMTERGRGRRGDEEMGGRDGSDPLPARRRRRDAEGS